MMGTILEEEETGHVVQWVFQDSRTIKGAKFQQYDVSDTISSDNGRDKGKNVDGKARCKPSEEHVRCLAWWLRNPQTYGVRMPDGKRYCHFSLYVVDGMRLGGDNVSVPRSVPYDETLL